MTSGRYSIWGSNFYLTTALRVLTVQNQTHCITKIPTKMYTQFSIGFNVDHMRISGTKRNYNVFITKIVIATLQNSFKAHFFQKGMQNRGEHHKCLINEEAMHPKAVSENYF